MIRTRETHPQDTLRVKVGDLAAATKSYASLGLRVLRRTSSRAVLELPSGIHVILYQAVTRTAWPARG